MPGDPALCRLYAARYLELSERAEEPARRESLRRPGRDVDKTSCRA